MSGRDGRAGRQGEQPSLRQIGGEVLFVPQVRSPEPFADSANDARPDSEPSGKAQHGSCDPVAHSETQKPILPVPPVDQVSVRCQEVAEPPCAVACEREGVRVRPCDEELVIAFQKDDRPALSFLSAPGEERSVRVRFVAGQSDPHVEDVAQKDHAPVAGQGAQTRQNRKEFRRIRLREQMRVGDEDQRCRFQRFHAFTISSFSEKESPIHLTLPKFVSY